MEASTILISLLLEARDFAYLTSMALGAQNMPNEESWINVANEIDDFIYSLQSEYFNPGEINDHIN